MSNLGADVQAAYAGLNVLDVSGRLAGAFAARWFGDFGADVILAEPASGHALRHEPPFSKAGDSALHTYVNWNKRSIAFDQLNDLAGLVQQADVVIATDLQTAAALEAWLVPTAVLLCCTAHGCRGELAARVGNNLTTSARTGWSYVNRLRGEPPLQMPRHQSGYVGGMAGYIAASAALLRRHQEPRAERVDVAETEAFAHTVHPWGIMAIYAGAEDSYGATGWRPRGAPGPLWQAGGGPMHLAIGDFHNWTAAMDAVGLPEFGRQDDLIPDMGRHGRNLGPVVEALGNTLPSLDRWEVFHTLARLRCVVGVVQNTTDLLQDAQFAARNYLRDVPLEGSVGVVKTAGPPLDLSPAPWRLQRPAPRRIAADRQVQFQQSNTPTSKSTEVAGAEGPLSGVRVLSFGQAWSGTFASQVLSLLGADVVQLGAIQRPDVWRRVRNEVPAGVRDTSRPQHPLNTSGLYNSVNLNKRELTLNLKDPQGMALFWRLIPNFDIVLDNFRSTVMPSWGVTLEKLHTLRPGVIWASISGYGTSGPYADFPANGASTEPMSGLSSLHGYAGDNGMNTAGLYPDPTSGYVLACGMLAALHQRDQSGAPQRVDVSMMEAVTTLCGDALIEHQFTGEQPGPMGNRHPRHAPHNNFACRNDQWLALATETDSQWQQLAQMVGGVLLESRWQSREYRKNHEDELEAYLNAWCKNRDAYDLERQLGEVGVAAARVVPLFELYTNPENALHSSGFIRQVSHPEAGPSYLPGCPWHFSQSPDLMLSAAPLVGEHSRELLRVELGIEDDEYEALVRAGITGTLAEHNLYEKQ